LRTGCAERRERRGRVSAVHGEESECERERHTQRERGVCESESIKLSGTVIRLRYNTGFWTRVGPGTESFL
jgi:hypothetical protein